VIRELYFRADQHTVLILECRQEAREILARPW
jgi:hypothetical protein